MVGRRWIVLVPVLVGAAVYAVIANPLLPMIPLQLAGNATEAREIIGDHRLDDIRQALVADWAVLIPGYVLTLLLAAWRMRRQRLLMVTIGGFAVLGGYCDVIENIYTWQGLDSLADADFQSAYLFALVKWLLLVPAGALAAFSLRRSSRG